MSTRDARTDVLQGTLDLMVLRTLLWDIKPEDPLTFVTTAGVLAAIGLAAAWMPARRAAGMDPMQALRHE
jgi:ABC-type lipoprotein release transport system permease subunit